MTHEEWITYGVKQGWVTAPVCYTHDGLPTRENEEADFDEGFDPCVFIMRLTENKDDQKNVEINHSPSAWRRSNRGIQ